MTNVPTPAELQSLHNWMREPDWAEEFSLADIVDWMNRRPTSVTARLATDPHCLAAVGGVRSLAERHHPSCALEMVGAASPDAEGAMETLVRFTLLG